MEEMKPARWRPSGRRMVLVVGIVVAGAGVPLAACSSPAALLGQGTQCLQTTDCQDGLVCVPQTTQKNAAKICSNNLATAVSTEEAGAPVVTDAAMGDGSQRADGAPAPGEAGPQPDASKGEPDAGETMEAQPPPMPEAAPPDDARPEAELEAGD